MTTSVDLRPGTLARHANQHIRILSILDLESVLVRPDAGGEPYRVPIKDLSSKSSAEDSQVREDLSLVSDEDWQLAQERFAIIQPLLREAPVRRTRQMVAQRALESKKDAATLYRWIGLYEREGRISALLRSPRSDRGNRRLSPDVEAIIEATIDQRYLTKERRTVQDACLEVARRCKEAGLPPPHPNTVRNRVARLSEKMRASRRLGRKVAARFEPNRGAFPGAEWPLSVVQIDHTKLDIILVDDIDRRPVGRPWITLAIDVYSRMVPGLYVSFDPPGALSTGLCIAHAVLPKESWLAKHEIAGRWPCWGMMQTLHLDNAREFRGNMLRRACEEYGIDLQWRPVARPQYGGHIERLLGTLLKEIHTLAGTTFSNPQARGEYRSTDRASMTLSEFERWLGTYIVEVYHQRIHTGIDATPLARYQEGILGTAERPGRGLPARPVDDDRLRLDFMPLELRTIQSYGVMIDQVHYYSDVLRPWINAVDPENTKRRRAFVFKRDPRDISAVHFFDPELKRYFRIPYRNTALPAISVWELREATQRVKADGLKDVDETAIFNAYQRMRDMEAEAAKATLKARRTEQRRREWAKQKVEGGAPATQSPERAETPEASQSRRTMVVPYDELDEDP